MRFFPTDFRDNRRYTFRRRGSDKAFTLIEVIVGLTLMATVLVGSLLAFSAHRKQLRVAEQKLKAVSIADDLLYRFSGQREGVPKAARGPVPGHPNWLWQTEIVGVAGPLQVPVQVVRLRVIEILPDGSALNLVSVDVVEPIS